MHENQFNFFFPIENIIEARSNFDIIRDYVKNKSMSITIDHPNNVARGLERQRKS